MRKVISQTNFQCNGCGILAPAYDVHDGNTKAATEMHPIHAGQGWVTNTRGGKKPSKHRHWCPACWPGSMDRLDEQYAADYNACIDNRIPFPQEVCWWYNQKQTILGSWMAVCEEFKLKNGPPLWWNRTFRNVPDPLMQTRSNASVQSLEHALRRALEGVVADMAAKFVEGMDS